MRRSTFPARTLAALSLAMLLVPEPARSAGIFTTIPTDYTTVASDVSDGGSVVVGRTGLSSAGFRWTAETGIVPLGTAAATGVSSDGQVVVVGPPGFRWTSQDGAVPLGFLPNGDYSQANGVSADGAVVVGTGNGTTYQAFRWTQSGGMIGAPLPAGTEGSGAQGVSADGSTAIGGVFPRDCATCSTVHREAARWAEDGSITLLGLLPGATESVASAASAGGSVAVGTASNTICDPGPTPSRTRAFSCGRKPAD